MAKWSGLDRQIQDAQRDRRDEERKEKWDNRGKKFWRTFLFTEDGRPKSSFGIYTFCLSFVFLAADMVIFGLVIDYLTPPMAAWPPVLSNLAQSLLAGALGLIIPLLLHRFCKDKRLAFGSFLWLALYAVLVLVSMLIILRGTGAAGAFMVFFAWFVVIPLALGLLVTGLLCRRDWHPPEPSGEEAPWKKYTQRR